MFFAAIGAAVVSTLGCGSVKVTKVAAAVQRPANVALFVDVRDDDGNGVKGLGAKNFKVYEDGKLLDPGKAKRAVLEPRTTEAKYTLLLVDMSGPLAASPDLSAVAAAAGRFIEQVGGKQMVGVSVFDGDDHVAPILDFESTGGRLKAVAGELKKFKPRSRNTNWNGAIFQGLHAVEEQMSLSSSTHKSAALVVLTDRGENLSPSVGVEAMRQKVRSSPAKIYVIGVGPGINRPELTAVGRDGAYLSTDHKDSKEGFDQTAKALIASSEGRYVFSYCSPKRKGDHKVEIEVDAPPGSGRVSYKFSADGFKAGCAPKPAPKFKGIDDDEGDKGEPGDDSDSDGSDGAGAGRARSGEEDRADQDRDSDDDRPVRRRTRVARDSDEN